MMMLGTSPLWASVSTVLCIGAHSDDIEIGCGGTILRLLRENPNVAIHWVVMSATGDRHDEALKSASSFLAGAARADVVVHDFEERYLPYIGGEVKRSFDELASTISPDLVLTHWQGDLHQDHRLLGELAWNTFRNQLILEYEIPKWDGDLGRPNVFVPLDRSICKQKVDTILQMFPSQSERDWFTEETFWALLRLRGVEARSLSGYAEAFHARKLILS